MKAEERLMAEGAVGGGKELGGGEESSKLNMHEKPIMKSVTLYTN